MYHLLCILHGHIIKRLLSRHLTISSYPISFSNFLCVCSTSKSIMQVTYFYSSLFSTQVNQKKKNSTSKVGKTISSSTRYIYSSHLQALSASPIPLPYMTLSLCNPNNVPTDYNSQINDLMDKNEFIKVVYHSIQHPFKSSILIYIKQLW